MTLDLLTLVIASLATARITNLIVHDAITEPLREWIFRLSPPDDLTHRSFDRRGAFITGQPRDPGWFGSLFSCTHCTGVWVAAGVLAALHWYAGPASTILAVAALSQAAEAATKVSR